MKHTKTYISRSGIIWCIILLIGLIMLVSGIIEQESYGKHYSFAEVTPDKIQIGDYVEDNITSFLITGDTYITAVSAEYNSSQVYNVPVGDGYYIRVLVSNPLTQQNLFDNMNGASKKVGFSGVVTSSPIGFNDAWYRQVVGFDPSMVMQDVVIQQVSTNWSLTRALLGFEIVVICFVFRISGVLPPLLTQDEVDKYLQPKRYTRSQDIEYELEHERNKLKTLEERMEQLGKEYRLGLFLVLFGIFGLAFAAGMSQMIPNAFPGIQTFVFSIPAIYIIILGGNMVYQYLKHTPGKFSRYYSGLKNYIPLPLEIEKCKLNIEALEKRLAEQNSLGPIYSDEMIYADF